MTDRNSIHLLSARNPGMKSMTRATEILSVDIDLKGI